MGLKSNQMGRIVCVAWIKLLGIPRNVGGRNKMGFKEGMFIRLGRGKGGEGSLAQKHPTIRSTGL